MRHYLLCLSTFALLFPLAAVALAAGEGQDDLNKATEAKLAAQTMADLDEVIRLAESALKKGLEEGDKQFADGLLASTLVQRGGVRAAMAARLPAKDPKFADQRKSALEDLDRAVKIDPNQAQAWVFIAQLNRLPGGDGKRADEALELAVKAAGSDPEMKSKVLQMRAQMSTDPAKKLADLDEAVKLMPGDAVAVRTRALVKADLGKLKEALEDLNKATELDPQHSPTFEAKAIVLVQLKRFDEALKALDEAQKIEPDSVVPIVQKARVLAAKLDLKAALAEIEKAKKVQPDNLSLYLLQATLEEEPAKKLAALDEAVKRSPKNSMPLRTRGLLLADDGKLDQAIADLDAAIALEPSSVANFEAKALVLVKAKRFDDAMAAADKIIELQPKSAEAKRFRATVLAEADRFDEAEAALKKLIEADADDLSSTMALALLYQSKKKIAKAIDLYNQILEREPEAEGVLRSRGDSQLNIGKHAEAIADYEKALKLAPQDTGVLNNLAWVLATSPDDKIRDGKRAIKLATEACELTEFKAPHILSTLGAAYAEAGDFDSATKWCEKGIEIAKDKEKESLGKELESYKAKKPIRELLNEQESEKK